MTTPLRCRWLLPCACVAAWGAAPPALAFDAAISAGARTVYLRVGDGRINPATFSSGQWSGQGTEVEGGINRVSATLTAAQLAASTPVAMASNSTDNASHYDNFAYCNAGELYVGGFYRRPTGGGGAPASVSLVADSSVPLSNGAGDTIPFTRISWTASGNDGSSQPIGAATFSGTAAQAIASFPANRWQESCHRFTYSNAAVVAAGTYTGRVTYTLSVP